MNYQRLNVHRLIADDLITYLDGGVKISDTLYNARCPVCGDGKTDKSKKRFFIYNRKGNHADDSTVFKCYCHNCSASNKICSGSWITTFVRELYPSIYERYTQQFNETNNSTNVVKNINQFIKKQSNVSELKQLFDTTHDSINIKYPENLFDMVRLDLILDHNPNHPIVKYVLERKLPIEQFNRLYVTNDYKRSMEHIQPFKENVKKLYSGTLALIMPMFNTDMKIIGIQSRFLSDNFRFLTLMLPEQNKLFGLETLDLNDTHYVVEAPLDSLHVNNSIATLDSNLSKCELIAKSFVYVYDNQPRNKEICKAILNTINQGKKVVIFSLDNKYKDINDMVRFGYIDNLGINKYLVNNTYQGDYALDKYYEWKKIAL